MFTPCSACGQPFHPSTGHCWTKNIVLCWSCTLDWQNWLKKRIVQFSHPLKGMKESFHDCALKSIKCPKDS